MDTKSRFWEQGEQSVLNLRKVISLVLEAALGPVAVQIADSVSMEYAFPVKEGISSIMEDAGGVRMAVYRVKAIMIVGNVGLQCI